MNCREGDLALIIRGRDAGKMVTCLRLVRAGELVPTSRCPAPVNDRSLPAWHVDRELTVRLLHNGSMVNCTTRVAFDKDLRPIRPEMDEGLEEAERAGDAARRRWKEHMFAYLYGARGK